VFSVVGVVGALCDAPTRGALRAIGEDFDWSSVDTLSVPD